MRPDDRISNRGALRKLRVARARRGAVAVEAAIVMPLLIIMMFGIWEVGRLIQVQQVITNAAREGARVASGGYVDGTPVTVAYVQSTVRNYMTASGLPTAAATGATITLTNTSANTWTDPVNAQPLDSFRVTVLIPSGTAFNSLPWSTVYHLTGVNSLQAIVNWRSANDTLINIDSSLPY